MPHTVQHRTCAYLRSERSESDRAQALAQLKREVPFLLMIDDAHGSLTLGERGGGCAEATGTCSSVDVHTGTLSKALGAQGGFVACSAPVKSFLVNHARSYVYSTAIPVPTAAGALAALRVFHGCVLQPPLHCSSACDPLHRCVCRRVTRL